MYILKVVCLPILLHAIEATSNINDFLRGLDRCIYLAIGKIFHTWTADIINAVRLYFDIPVIKNIVDKRREKYLSSLVELQQFEMLFKFGGLHLM